MLPRDGCTSRSGAAVEPEELEMTESASAVAAPHALEDLRELARRELAGAIVGYEEPLDLLLVASVAGGHVLLEGPPGVAKTLMAGAVARVLGVSFSRVQFTPDTAPDDLIGKNVVKMGEPVFFQGPIFTNILLADEVNRTPPRTQAALLEAMQERHVTVEGRTHWLPTPFMVVATQNPFEHEGIYPLPESQLDRFLFKITLGYGTAQEEEAILHLPHRGLTPDVLGDVQPLLDVARLDAAQRELDSIPVPDHVVQSVVHVVRHTRETSGVVLGASPRAAIHLLNAAKAHARLSSREAPTFDDVAAMARYVLCHRIIVQGVSPKDVVSEAVDAARP
jgi:MoxR-like ATPase